MAHPVYQMPACQLLALLLETRNRSEGTSARRRWTTPSSSSSGKVDQRRPSQLHLAMLRPSLRRLLSQKSVSRLSADLRLQRPGRAAS